MRETLLQQGVELMLYGMGTVFVFLTILVAATSIMSTLITRFSADEAAPAAALTTDSTEDKKRLAIIAAAIHAHRSRQK